MPVFIGLGIGPGIDLGIGPGMYQSWNVSVGVSIGLGMYWFEYVSVWLLDHRNKVLINCIENFFCLEGRAVVCDPKIRAFL